MIEYVISSQKLNAYIDNSNYLLRMCYQRKAFSFIFFLFLFLLVNSQKNKRFNSGVNNIQPQANRLENLVNKISGHQEKSFTQSQTSRAQNSQHNTIQNTQSKISEPNNQHWYVIVSIIAGCLIFIVFAIILYKTLLSKYCCDQNWYYAPQWIQMIPQQLSHEFYTDYLRFLDADDLCSICLSGKCDSITSCRDIYHLQCFLLWFKTNKSCPNCRKEQFSLNYFCWQCKKKYCHLDSSDMIDKCSSYLKEFPKCDRCYEEQLKQQQSKKPVIGIKQFPIDNINIGNIILPEYSKKQHIASQSQENIAGYLQSLNGVQQ